jgi:hypothetical protein
MDPNYESAEETDEKRTFFFESAGELRIILIREEKRSKMDQGTKP